MDQSFRLFVAVLGLLAALASAQEDDMTNYKCAFRPPPKAIRDQYEAQVSEYIAGRKHQGKDDDDDDEVEVVELIKIPTYWHNIETDAGFGGVTLEQIEANMAVLNDSFESAGFYFELMAVTNTMNSDYYSYSIDLELPPGDDPRFQLTPVQSEARMKTELKEGGCNTLNIYSNQPFEGNFFIIGDSTVPFFCQGADTTMDGVIVNTEAVVGGSFTGLNRGKVLVHEVGHW